jgi:hypothetical protein
VCAYLCTACGARPRALWQGQGRSTRSLSSQCVQWVGAGGAAASASGANVPAQCWLHPGSSCHRGVRVRQRLDKVQGSRDACTSVAAMPLRPETSSCPCRFALTELTVGISPKGRQQAGTRAGGAYISTIYGGVGQTAGLHVPKTGRRPHPFAGRGLHRPCRWDVRGRDGGWRWPPTVRIWAKGGPGKWPRPAPKGSRREKGAAAIE